MASQLTVTKSPSDELSLTNCVVLNHERYNVEASKFNNSLILLEIKYEHGKSFIFGIKVAKNIDKNKIGLSYVQRNWTKIPLNAHVNVKFFKPASECYLTHINVKVDFLQKKGKTAETYDTVEMSKEFVEAFTLRPFCLEQEFIFKIGKKPYLVLTVDKMVYIEEAALGRKKSEFGIFNKGTISTFGIVDGSDVKLSGKFRENLNTANNSIFKPDWDFSKMGIGGLDEEISTIFRRAFASRVYPPDIIEELGYKHVKGILLYGPPGTGKTLMARQIGAMLNSTEPKIVNGPEILSKYVGESESNVRELFKDAAADEKKYGQNSPLHMIIFDEIDAICKQRGTVTGNSGVGDTVVNQLLSKIDGVEQLNNLIVIGMTNRKDLIDEALLRPGRLEVQLEINLPDEKGRLQILNIHTAKYQQNKRLADDISLTQIAVDTKNFSGAEIEGLVRSATSTAMHRLVPFGEDGSILKNQVYSNLIITNADFQHALKHDIKPAFGTGIENASHFLSNGLIMYGQPMEDIMKEGKTLLRQTEESRDALPISVLFEGLEGSGKTAIAAHLAYKSGTVDFPFIKVVSPENMIGFSESAKCQAIKKVFDDASKSELSCIIVDDIERLLEFVPLGQRFSNLIYQTLIVLLKKKLRRENKLLIIATSSSKEVLERMNLVSCFNMVTNVPQIKNNIHLANLVEKTNVLTADELREFENALSGKQISVSVRKLINLLGFAAQKEERRVETLVQCLIDASKIYID